MNFIRSRDIWGIFWLMAVSCPRRSIVALVDSLSLCDDWKYLEVIEKSDDNTFTCTGLRAQQDVVWSWDTDRIAICPPPTSSCTVDFPAVNKFFRFSRTSTTASNITVLATAAPSLDYFGTTSLTCEITPQESVTCPMDSVYPAENITCKVQFNGDTWEVTSWCFVSKVRSTRNKYGCYLYQTQGSQDSVRVGSYNMSREASKPSSYFSGTCNMTSDLPSEGRYSYTVLIMPGQVNVPAVFYGSNEIRRPKSIPYHNCPLYVKENNPVSCVCSVDDLGSPPGQLKWNNTSSEQLLLPGVKMDQHGVNYVCSLTWNKTVVQLVTYTLLIAYPPTQMSFKLNNKSDNVDVMEKSPVTMLCQSDGRPTPNMTITDVTNGNRVLHSLPGGNVTLADHTVQTPYDKATVECEDTGEYKCSADNIIGSKYQAVKLLVMCKPRRSDASPTPPTIVEGQTTSFELIAYPNSVIVTKYFMGSNNCNSETPAYDDIFHVVCSPNSQLLYKVTCTVTVIKVTVNTAGLYKAVVSNDLGSVALIFEALPLNTTERETRNVASSEFSRGLGIGLGIAAAEAVVVATIHLVFYWRRKQRIMKAKGGRNNAGYSSREDISHDKTTELTLSSGQKYEGAYEAISNSEAGHTPAYTNVQGSHLSSRETSNKTGNVYDGLHLQNVGVTSPYASLT